MNELKFTSVISPLYISCFKSNKKRRTDFLIGILRRCELQCQSISSLRVKIQSLMSLQNKNSINGDVENDTFLTNSTLIETLSKLIPRSELDQINVSSNTSSSVSSTSTTTTSNKKNKYKIQNILDQACEKFEFVTFLCTILSSLPYSLVDEPLNIIYWINRNTNITTSIFEKLYSSCLLQVGSSYLIDSPHQNHFSKVTKKNQNNSPSSSLFPVDIDPSLPYELDQLLVFNQTIQQEKKLNLSVIDSVLLSLLSIECQSRIVLLRLKGFLKTTFSFSDERCLAFTPSLDKENQDGKNNRISQCTLSESEKKHHQTELFLTLPSFLDISFQSYQSNKHVFTSWKTQKIDKLNEGKTECDLDVDVSNYNNLSNENEEIFLRSCIRSYNCLYSLMQIDTNDFTFHHKIEKKMNQKKDVVKIVNKVKSSKIVNKKKKVEKSNFNCNLDLGSKTRTSERKRKLPIRDGRSGEELDESSDQDKCEVNDSDYEN